MKKIALLVLALAVALPALAALSTGGTIGTPLVDKDGNGKLVIRVLSVDSQGTPVPTPGASVVSGALSVTVTSSPSLVPTGMTNYSALSTAATTVNLTTSAGASVPCMVCLDSNGGAAAGFKVQFTTSATAPVALTSSSQGHYVAATASAQCWGPWAPGTHLHAAGVAATSSILVDIQKVQ